MNDWSEQRTFRLDPEVVQQLAELGVGDAHLSSEELSALLPSGLTSVEVNDVGLQIDIAVERENPSRDGCSHGHKAEGRHFFIWELLHFYQVTS